MYKFSVAIWHKMYTTGKWLRKLFCFTKTLKANEKVTDIFIGRGFLGRDRTGINFSRLIANCTRVRTIARHVCRLVPIRWQQMQFFL